MRQAIKVIPTTEPSTTTQPGTVNREHIDYKLVPSRKHPAFAGPAHLEGLHGDCFETIVGSCVCAPQRTHTTHTPNASHQPPSQQIALRFKQTCGWTARPGCLSHNSGLAPCLQRVRRSSHPLLRAISPCPCPHPTAPPRTCRYEWRVCPFDNVTQHEVNSAWNPYNGILG